VGPGTDPVVWYCFGVTHIPRCVYTDALSCTCSREGLGVPLRGSSDHEHMHTESIGILELHWASLTAARCGCTKMPLPALLAL